LKIARRLGERIRQSFLLPILELGQTVLAIPKKIDRFWHLIGKQRGICYIVIFFALFGFLHMTFLSDWKVSDVESTIYVVADSTASGVFRINFASGLNATLARVYPTNITISTSESAIDLSISNLTKGTVSKVYVQHIQLRVANLPLNWPKHANLVKLVDCMPPENFDGTIYLTNRIMASTRFGQIPIYQVSFGTVWIEGEDRYLDEDKPFHEAYRIPDLLDWFFIGITLIITGLIGSRIQVPFCTKRYPYLTLMSYSMLLGLFVFFGTGFNAIYYNFDEFTYKILVATLSPFFHWEYDHLTSNMAPFLLASIVLESGLKWRKLRYRALFYYFPILLPTYLIVIGQWVSSSRFTFGLSLAIIWFSVEYCFITLQYRKEFFSEQNFTKHFVFSLLIGYVVVGGPYNWLSIALTYPSLFSSLGFAVHGLAFVLACLFFYKCLVPKCKKWNALEI